MITAALESRPTDQPVRFRTTAEYTATYNGHGEFYTGIRNGDRVTVRIDTQTYTNHDGRVAAASHVSIQKLADPGAWLCLYDRLEALTDITPA